MMLPTSKDAATLAGVFVLLLGLPALFEARSAAPAPFELQRNDVVAFLGGANTVAAQETGHLEALLTVQFKDSAVRFRNLAWEGDTVYSQPRELNFPSLTGQLQKAGITVVLLCFGQTEALDGRVKLAEFVAAYEKLLDQCGQQSRRIGLITPTPFETPQNALLPNLAFRNEDLRLYVQAMGRVAQTRGFWFVDLFSEGGKASVGPWRLTENGLHLTPAGQAAVAARICGQLGFGQVAKEAGGADNTGRWSNPAFERLRQVIVAKNQLWFDYWRPMNWAFLAGDRTEQPSSRDHRDPKIRWFPTEMERFLPLIEAKEREINQLARELPK